jgi:hypothetical protein
VKKQIDETIVKKFNKETKTKGNTKIVCLTEQVLVNALKIAAVLGELLVPEYPQVPANIPATTPSNQVNIVTEPDVQQKTAKADVMSNCVR